MLKIDFVKAFDTIEHSAMLLIMQKMGFPKKWLTWMESIFSLGKSSILLNGYPANNSTVNVEYNRAIHNHQ